jgi:hypothetical protein
MHRLQPVVCRPGLCQCGVWATGHQLSTKPHRPFQFWRACQPNCVGHRQSELSAAPFSILSPKRGLGQRQFSIICPVHPSREPTCECTRSHRHHGHGAPTHAHLDPSVDGEVHAHALHSVERRCRPGIGPTSVAGFRRQEAEERLAVHPAALMRLRDSRRDSECCLGPEC